MFTRTLKYVKPNNKCRKCGHCDTSYEENPNLVCNCKFCDCYSSALVKLTLAANKERIK